MTRAYLLAILVVTLAPLRARAAPAGEGPSGRPMVGASVAGGGDFGRSAVTGVSEVEVAAGLDAGRVQPEVAAVFGLAPGTYGGFRPGVRVYVPETPLQVRGALDLARIDGDWRFRWLLVGVAFEVRATDVVAAFAEVDGGVPLTGDAGVCLLGRAGVRFRL